MLRRFKSMLAVLTIVILLPYIITIFANGQKVEKEKNKDAKEELLKQHCIGLLAKEVSSDYEKEMLKVQSVLVRTTFYREVEELGEDIFKQENFGNIDDVDPALYRKLQKIWEETEGEVVLYNGALALVPFHQISNGKTRIGKEVFGEDTYPYLKMLECPKDVEADHQMESKFISVTGASIEEVDSSGYVLSVKIGEEVINGESFRDTYGLKSSCFELQAFSEKTRVITKGVGHGLGLSQHTANEMAKEGKSYKDILQHFFEGTEIQEVAEILWNIE